MSEAEIDPVTDATPRKVSLLWPTVLTLVGLAVLLSLGTWQMQRLAWKEALIARVETASKSAPVPLEKIAGFVADASIDLPADLQFRRVTLSGTFDHANEFHVWSPGKQGPAWSVVTPLRLASPLKAEGTTTDSVLVIRGVVLDRAKAAATRSAGNPAGEVTITGRVRFGHVGTFSKSADTSRNEWLDFNLDGMAATLLPAGATRAGRAIAPFFVEAEAPTGGAGAPQPDLAAVNLSNRHLEYALTWYGLAVTLAGVYLAYAFSRRRRVGDGA